MIGGVEFLLYSVNQKIGSKDIGVWDSNIAHVHLPLSYFFFHSGYGSGAVSSTTLSEDSLSMRSVSVDETPDKDIPTSHATMDISTIR